MAFGLGSFEVSAARLADQFRRGSTLGLGPCQELTTQFGIEPNRLDERAG
jgi:hypothetical protein